MKERGILFSAPMVRALLAGRKTQTRRLYKPLYPSPYEYIEDGKVLVSDEAGEYSERVVYGVPGDRLWVRETWRRDGRLHYRADQDQATDGFVWKPGIHLCRADARITLEVTDVRVEKLQDISEAGAKAEGVTPDADCLANHCARPHWDRFMDLWDEINGKRATWQSNPWVWAISFRLT